MLEKTAIDEPTLLVLDVARGAGISSSDLRRWHKQKSIEIAGNDKANGPHLRILSRRTGYKIAVTARMVAFGIPVSQAYLAARVELDLFEVTQGEVFFIMGPHPKEGVHIRTVLGRARLAELIAAGDEDVRAIVNVSKIVADFDARI